MDEGDRQGKRVSSGDRDYRGDDVFRWCLLTHTACLLTIQVSKHKMDTVDEEQTLTKGTKTSRTPYMICAPVVKGTAWPNAYAQSETSCPGFPISVFTTKAKNKGRLERKNNAEEPTPRNWMEQAKKDCTSRSEVITVTSRTRGTNNCEIYAPDYSYM